MRRYDVIRITDDLEEIECPPVWASTPRNALNMAGTRHYGAKGFVLVPDSTAIGGHARKADGTECLEVR